MLKLFSKQWYCIKFFLIKKIYNKIPDVYFYESMLLILLYFTNINV